MESDALLESYLRQLHLTSFAKYYRPFAVDAARSNLAMHPAVTATYQE